MNVPISRDALVGFFPLLLRDYNTGGAIAGGGHLIALASPVYEHEAARNTSAYFPRWRLLVTGYGELRCRGWYTLEAAMWDAMPADCEWIAWIRQWTGEIFYISTATWNALKDTFQPRNRPLKYGVGTEHFFHWKAGNSQ